MKKFIVMLVLVLVASVSFSAFNEDLDVAKSLASAGDLVGAQAAYEQILVDYPEQEVDVLARTGLQVGFLLMRQKKFVEAQTKYEKVITDYPAADMSILIHARVKIGDLFVRRNMREEARMEYDKVVDDYPAANYIWLLGLLVKKGQSFMKQGMYEEAQAEYEAVLTTYPEANENKLASAIMNVGNCLLNRNMLAEAQAKYDQVATSYPTTPYAMRSKVQSLRVQFQQGFALTNILQDAMSSPVLPSPVLQTYQAKYGEKRVVGAASLDEIFSIIMSHDQIKPMEFNEAIAERATIECQKGVKSVIRDEGLTFVGDAGKSNITAKLSVVVEALNAPALEGLEAAFTSCGVTIEPLDRTYVKSFGKLIADKVMHGELAPDSIRYLPHVYIALGYDKFQEWMTIYNEGGTFDWPE